jgi:hypothetical protein
VRNKLNMRRKALVAARQFISMRADLRNKRPVRSGAPLISQTGCSDFGPPSRSGSLSSLNTLISHTPGVEHPPEFHAAMQRLWDIGLLPEGRAATELRRLKLPPI